MTGNIQNITKFKSNRELMKKYKAAMAELLEEKAKAEALLAAIGDGVIAADMHGKITYANGAAQKMLGYPLSKMIGKKCGQILSHGPGTKGKKHNQRGCLFCQARKTQKVVTKTLKDNYYYSRADGTNFPVYITASAVRIRGADAGGILIFRDISMEKEIDKMKSEFVSLSSHQLRTPITSIKWLAESLLKKTADNITPIQRKMIEDIYASNQRMIMLVNALLNVARLEMGTFRVAPKMLDIEKICLMVMRELETKIKEKNLQIRTACPYGLRQYRADPRLVEIIFQNLMSNAVKYSDRNSVIYVEGRIAKNELIISVRNNGIGIPKWQQSKIFTKLFRADNARKIDADGTGLGLYITKLVTEAAGGKIWFKSEENARTTFFVALPRGGMKQKAGNKPLV